MHTEQKLGYLGLIPFVLSFVIAVIIEDWRTMAFQVFIAYSAIILSFISGTLWRSCNDNTLHSQKIVSNIFSLVAFASLLIEQVLALALLSLAYLVLYLYEKKSAAVLDLSNEYITMRFTLTFIVTAMHLLILLL